MDKKTRTPRRQWPRIPIPPEMFDVLQILAKARGHTERDMYHFIYEAVRECYPDDVQKMEDVLGNSKDTDDD